MATSLLGPIVQPESDDEYTIEYYEYEMTDEESMVEREKYQDYNRSSTSVISVETVEEDDDDEYTYEEEILEVVMEDKEDDMDSTSEPPPLPTYRTNGTDTDATPSCFDPKPAPSPKPVPQPKTLPAYVTTSHPKSLPDYVPKDPITKTQDTKTPAATKPESLLKPPPDCAPSPRARKFSPLSSSYGMKEAPELLTPSKQRAKAAGSAGLSELSKQLRILQAKNESQAVDVHRLERQLRILADLQGISVDNLRKALEDACASEAFEELQNRVSKLKYELEAATLAKKAELRKDAAAPHIANLELRVGELEEVEEKQRKEIRDLYESLRQERAQSTRLESENQQLKGALQDMILRAQNEAKRASQVEASFQRQLQELRERQSKKIQEEAERTRSLLSASGKSSKKSAMSSSGMISPQMAAEYDQMVQLLKKKDEELRDAKAKLQASEMQRTDALKEAQDRSRQIQMDMKVEADKLVLTVKELEDADGQNGLRLAQYKARFAVQDERIVDMGQQLDSLYTAFDLLKEEFDSENVRHAAMMSNLNDADAEIARQTEKRYKEKSKSQRRRDHGFPPSPTTSKSHSDSARAVVHERHISAPPVPPFATTPPNAAIRKPAIATLAPVSPATPSSYRDPYHDPYEMASFTNRSDRTHEYDTPTTYATAQAFHPTPEKTPSTWELLRSNEDQSRLVDHQYGHGMRDYYDKNESGDTHQAEDELIVGMLLVESNSIMRKWKLRPSRIYLREEGYQWQIGDKGYQWKMGDKRSFPIQFGISKVEFHPNKPLSFAVHLDPTTPDAPVIRAATYNERDYHRWMAALTKATTGEEYQGGGSEILETHSPSIPTSLVAQPSNNYGSSTPASGRSLQSDFRAEESEDADLRRILELSKYET